MAQGKVSWVNPPENKGKISRTDVSSSVQFEYNVMAGDTVGGYVPQMGDTVEFHADETSKHATQVKQAITLSINYFRLEGATLSWDTSGAVRGNIDKLGGVPVPSGSISVGRTTTPYKLTIWDALENTAEDIIV